MLSVAGLLISGFLASRWMGGRWQAELATISCARAVTILIIRSTKLLALVGCAYLVVLSVAAITTPPPRPPAGPGPPPSVLLEEEFDSSPYPTEESPKVLSSPPKDQTAVNKGTGGISALIAGKVLSWGRRLLIPLAFGGLLWGLERRLVRQSKALT